MGCWVMSGWLSSQAVSISDVCDVLRSEMAEAVGAERSYAALADDDGAVFTPIGCDTDTEQEAAEGPASLLQPLKQAFHERRPIWPTLGLAVSPDDSNLALRHDDLGGDRV